MFSKQPHYGLNPKKCAVDFPLTWGLFYAHNQQYARKAIIY